MRVRDFDSADMKKLILNEIQNQANTLDNSMRQWIKLRSHLVETEKELIKSKREKIEKLRELQEFYEKHDKIEKEMEASDTKKGFRDLGLEKQV